MGLKAEKELHDQVAAGHAGDHGMGQGIAEKGHPPEDDQAAADAGVDGLMVSNHGARQLDRAPSPLDVLPHIEAAVGDRMTLMLDGGIRRGSDVVTALAMGAKFVFLGRATLYGAVAGGDEGASLAVRIVREEIDRLQGAS